MNSLIKVSDRDSIVLTPHQNEGLDKLKNWNLNSTDNFFFTLKGSAGVGKTTVLRKFIQTNRFNSGSIAVTAPTHKAKKVIHRSTGLQALTIQSLLGLRPNTDLDNFDINKPQFDKLADPFISMYKLVIIDEASMLNADLHEMICKEAIRYRTKVLFVGDELQLPPVNESQSKSLTQHNTAELTEIIRQANTNPLTILLAALRDDIVNETNTFVQLINDIPSNVNDNQEGYEVLELPDFSELVNSYFISPEYAENPDYVKFVAWTNECVTQWNRYIRTSRFNSPFPIVENDIMMAYTTVMNEYQEAVIINSEDYIIDSVVDTINAHEIGVYRCQAHMLEGGLTSFDIVKTSAIPDFLKTERELHTTAIDRKGRAWVQYYKFKNAHLLSNDIKRNDKLVVKKDIDYGYAITVHKTQGSTYQNVFVNLPNINRNSNSVERKKLIYVALSRASKKAIILKP